MTIWVDADACPKPIREILCRAAVRTQTKLIFVANQLIAVPVSPYISALQVERGFDVADHVIVAKVQLGDWVITSDIPLAADVIAKGGEVLTPRGERYTAADIGARLTMRDFMDTMRASGVQTGGEAPFSNADKLAFAKQLDTVLSQANARPPLTTRDYF